MFIQGRYICQTENKLWKTYLERKDSNIDSGDSRAKPEIYCYDRVD